MVVQGLIVGAKVGALAAKKGSELSTDIFKYDFVSLITKLIIFFVGAYIVAKIFEAIIFGQGLIVSFVALFGLKLPRSLPEPIVNFFQEGIKGFRYWDFIKLAAIILVIMEWNNWQREQKAIGIKPSPMTTGVFGVIVGGMVLITIPELWTRFKEIRQMNLNISNSISEDDTDETGRKFRAGR